jgi:hypothetical protein
VLPRGVLDENACDLEDALLVGESERRTVDVCGKRMLARLGERPELLAHDASALRHVDLDVLDRELAPHPAW